MVWSSFPSPLIWPHDDSTIVKATTLSPFKIRYFMKSINMYFKHLLLLLIFSLVIQYHFYMFWMKTLHKGVPKYQYYDISGYFTVHYQYAGGKFFFFLKKHTLLWINFVTKMCYNFSRLHKMVTETPARGSKRRNQNKPG